jgi:hypothetical protein
VASRERLFAGVAVTWVNSLLTSIVRPSIRLKIMMASLVDSKILRSLASLAAARRSLCASSA